MFWLLWLFLIGVSGSVGSCFVVRFYVGLGARECHLECALVCGGVLVSVDCFLETLAS